MNLWLTAVQVIVMVRQASNCSTLFCVFILVVIIVLAFVGKQDIIEITSYIHLQHTEV